MKKIIIGASVLGAMLMGHTTQAQELTYGLKAGYTVSNVHAQKKSDITETKSMSSFNVAAYVDINFTDHFSLQTGLSVIGKGSSIAVGQRNDFTWTEYNSNPIYLELPINAVAKIPLGNIYDRCNIILGGGPYVAMGVAGKNRMNGNYLGRSFSTTENLNFSNDDQPVNSTNYYGEFKKFDVGINALAGIEYHWFTFNLNYGYGVVNVNPGANLTQIDRFKNRTFSASVGVRL
jgi:hypothetical protein